MLEIFSVIGLSALGLFAAIVVGDLVVFGRRRGPHERALVARWVVYSGLLMMTMVVWVVAGIAAFLFGTEFWRQAWIGGSILLWLGYAPALVWTARSAHRQAM